jgi:hypothetical protein
MKRNNQPGRDHYTAGLAKLDTNLLPKIQMLQPVLAREIFNVLCKKLSCYKLVRLHENKNDSVLQS